MGTGTCETRGQTEQMTTRSKPLLHVRKIIKLTKIVLQFSVTILFELMKGRKTIMCILPSFHHFMIFPSFLLCSSVKFGENLLLFPSEKVFITTFVNLYMFTLYWILFIFILSVSSGLILSMFIFRTFIVNVSSGLLLSLFLQDFYRQCFFRTLIFIVSVPSGLILSMFLQDFYCQYFFRTVIANVVSSGHFLPVFLQNFYCQCSFRTFIVSVYSGLWSLLSVFIFRTSLFSIFLKYFYH